MSKWSKTYFKAKINSDQIDIEEGILRDVVMCQVGPAKGHGVHLEQEFIEQTVNLGQEQPQGLKARFGHPMMSTEALGTGLGRFHNVRLRGNQAIGDLHLAEYSQSSPEGDLRTYILERAQEDPDSFGSSIVFIPGEKYKRNENGEKVYRFKEVEGERVFNKEFRNTKGPVFDSITQLLGCDLVDEPAATNSLFHSKFNSHAFAVQIETFLDENPELETFLNEHPNLEGKIASYLRKRKVFKGKSPMNKQIKRLKEGMMSLFASIEATETEENQDLSPEAFQDLQQQLAEAKASEAKAQELVAEQLSQINDLTAQVNKLKGEKEALSIENKALSTENQKLGSVSAETHKEPEGEDLAGASSSFGLTSADIEMRKKWEAKKKKG